MKKLFNAKSLLIATGVCAVLAASTASAEYRVTAFGQSAGFTAILAGDIESATAVLGSRSLTKMDFVDANNLCVTQILSAEYEAAVASCSMALEAIKTDLSVGIMTERGAKASIYSNLAVALAKSGDLTAASAALETALSLNSTDSNAIANHDLVSAQVPDRDLAQGF